MMVDQALCSLCASITIAKLHSNSGYQHLSDVRELVMSALNCALCRLLLDEALQKPASIRRDERVPYMSLTDALEEMGIDSFDSVALTLKIEDALIRCYLNDGGTTCGVLGRDPLRIFRPSEEVKGMRGGILILLC
jgi:hypothetical protein